MNSPRTVREEMVSVILGELDTLLARVEALPAMVESAEKHIAETVAALDGAGDKYRMAITAFSEQAKADLNEYLDRKAAQVSAKTMEEQRAAIQDATLTAFRSEAFDKAAGLGVVLADAAREFKRSQWARLAEHGFTAVLSSALTGWLVFAIAKHSG